jgi:hypothetical protein
MHRHFSSLRSIEELNGLEMDKDRLEERAYSTDDTLNGIYVCNEFEISEEPNDMYWGLTTPKDKKSDYLPSFLKDMPQTQTDRTTPPPSPLKAIKQTFHPHISETTSNSITAAHEANDSIPLLTRDPLALVRRPPPTSLTTTISPTVPLRSTIKARETHIQKLLLFNAYPAAYIILWIPGILNRFIELSGHSSRPVAILQASTQFVGLANACM